MTDRDGTLEGDPEQYDVTWWEDRTPLDHLAVAVYGFLLRRWESLLVALAVVLLVAQFALAAVVVARNPWVLGFAVLSVVPALLLVGVVRRFDPEPQPIGSMAVTFALGGLFGFIVVYVGGFGVLLYRKLARYRRRAVGG